jgi:hypothetical protein
MGARMSHVAMSFVAMSHVATTDPGKGTPSMNSRMYAIQADDMAGNARVRAFQPCPVSVVFAPWSPISLGTTATAAKHGRPRRLEVSHP